MSGGDLHRAHQLVQLKQREEQKASALWTEARIALGQGQERLRQIEAWQRDYETKAGSLRKAPHVGVLKDWRTFLEGLAVQRQRAQAAVEGLEAACEERKGAFLRCLQQRKVAERYQASIKEADAKKRRQQEARALDDLVGRPKPRTLS